MKRLVTILLLFAALVNNSTIQAQNLPMAVAGDMYIKGSMYSKGVMHIKANTVTPGDTVFGRVDNYGTLKLKEGVILYSNDRVDGLLRNKATGTNSIEVETGGAVTVRKFFKKVFRDPQYPNNPDYEGNYFNEISFPFAVEIKKNGSSSNNIITSVTQVGPGDSRDLTKVVPLWGNNNNNNGGLWIEYYDAEKRAIDGLSHSDTSILWKYVDEDILPALKAGTGYRFYSWSDHYLDFNLTNRDSIEKLFKYEDKNIPLKYYENNILLNYHEAAGWNIIGGLSTAAYELKYLNGFNGVIYYYDIDDVSSNIKHRWKEIITPYDLAILSPYVSYYVQTNADKNLIYKSDGYSLMKANPIGFRASEDTPEKDVLRLTITNPGNPGKKERIYIELAPDYNNYFKSGEDGIRLINVDNGKIEVDSKSTQLWSYNVSPENELYRMVLDRRASVAKQEIKLGVTFPLNGYYEIALEVLSTRNLKKAVLKDFTNPQNVVETDMLKGNYPFYSKYGANESRFALFLDLNEEGGASIDIPENVDTRNIYAYASNNVLTVKNLQKGDQVKVMDVSGRMITSGTASSDEFSADLTQKGVYIVSISSEKSLVLKVLNK